MEFDLLLYHDKVWGIEVKIASGVVEKQLAERWEGKVKYCWDLSTWNIIILIFWSSDFKWFGIHMVGYCAMY